MACWLYEGMLLFGVMVSAGLVYFVAAYWLAGFAPGDMHIQPQLKSGLQAVSFFVLGLYFTWMWHRGQTLAMKTWRIEIVDESGRRVSRKTAFKRYLASWLWFLPPIIASVPFKLTPTEVGVLTSGWVVTWGLLSKFHPQKQFLHDALAKTRLISTR